jgi:DNA-binding response OmpR family regulator
MTHVLVVEDDLTTAREIEAALHDHGFTVTLAGDGRQGIVQALSSPFDLIVLDRMLPGSTDGLGVLTALRSAGVATPVLILSALGALDERVRGLRAGGDDYLTKPFEFIELTARLDAQLRRSGAPVVIELLPREYALLEHLTRHAGEVVTRTMLFEAVWNYSYDERTNVIEVHIGRLRRKIDAEGEAPMLHTIRGAGYVLRAPE